MNEHRSDTTPPSTPAVVSAGWLRILDLGIPGEAPRRDEELAVSVFARLADCMP